MKLSNYKGFIIPPTVNFPESNLRDCDNGKLCVQTRLRKECQGLSCTKCLLLSRSKNFEAFKEFVNLTEKERIAYSL